MEVRKARLGDANALLALKNDPKTRKFSIKTHDRITYQNHIKWLTARLDDPKTCLYVIVKNGWVIGDIRFDIHPKDIEVGIRINRLHRNRGIAKGIVGRIGDQIQKSSGLPLLARIVVGNIPSMRVFLSNGFKPEKYKAGVYYLYKR